MKRKLDVLRADETMATELKPDVQILELRMAELINLDEMIAEQLYLMGNGMSSDLRMKRTAKIT